MDLGSTQPLTEKGGKGGRCVGLTTLPPSVPSVSKSGSLNLLEPSGPVIGLHRDRCTVTLRI